MEGLLSFFTQSFGKLTGLDLAIIATYMLMCLIIGFWKAGSIKNIRHFALGEGIISNFVLVSTIYATHLGAGVTFGTVEKIGDIGILFAIAALASPIGWMLTAWIFGRNIERFNDCLGISDVMYYLYGSAGRWCTNIVSVIISIGIVAVQVSALGYVLSYYLGISLHYGVVLGVFVLVTYSAIGGVKAVAITDVIQFIVFYIAMPCLCAVGLYHVGGISGIQNILPEHKLSPDLNSSNFMLFIGIMIYSIMPHASGSFMQRFLMSKDSNKLISSLKAVAMLDVMMMLIICALGFIVAALAPGEGTVKVTFLDSVHTLLPMGIAGFVVCGFLAIIMSSADSCLNTVGVICAHDIIKPIWPTMTDNVELKLARITTVIIGIMSIALALSGPGILELVWLVDNFYAPGILVPLAAGFLGLKTNGISLFGAIIMGGLGVLWGANIQGSFDVVSLMIGLSGSIIGLIGMHHYQIRTGLMDRRAKVREEDEYQGRVHPQISLRLRIRDFLRQFKPKSITNAMRRSVLRDPPRYYAFVLLCGLLNLFPILVMIGSGYAINANCNTELCLRLSAVFGCVLLCFYEQWPKYLKPLFAPYWYALQTFCLPVLAAYSLTLHDDNAMWLPYTIAATMMLAAFAHNALLFVAMTALGCSLGVLLAKLQIAVLGIPLMQLASDVIGRNTMVVAYIAIGIAISAEIVKRIINSFTLALFDKLSTLRNRRYIDLHFGDALKDGLESAESVSLLMIDVDNFGKINKDYCQQSGDMVLQELGKTMKGSFWNQDLCARYGGEEFLVLLRHTNLSDARSAAERLRRTVAERKFSISMSPYQINCTVSIGIATLRPGESGSSLIARANAAMLAAKRQGRNMVATEEAVTEDNIHEVLLSAIQKA